MINFVTVNFDSFIEIGGNQMSEQRKDYETVLETSNVEANNKKTLEDICKDKMIYVSAKPESDQQVDKNLKKALERPPVPDRGTRVSAEVSDRNGGYIQRAFVIPQEELWTRGLADISEATTYSGRVVAISNYKIAESILTASRNVATILERYIDVVEHRNILDEYYRLLNDIEKYESILMELGCIADAYDKLDLLQYPTIDVDEREIWMLMHMVDESNLNKIIAVSKQNFLNPFKLLWIYMENVRGWCLKKTANEGVGLATLKCNNINIPVKAKVETGRKAEIIGVSPSLFRVDAMEFKEEKKENYYNSYIIAFDGFAKEVIESVYNSISERSLKTMFMKDAYITVVNGINSINQSIQLTNLRNLHSGLRYQVRRCRIERSLSDQ